MGSVLSHVCVMDQWRRGKNQYCGARKGEGVFVGHCGVECHVVDSDRENLWQRAAE